MSWSVHYIGKPAAVLQALEDHADKITDGTSRAEYLAALPGLQVLVAQNFDNEYPFRGAIQLEAGGSGVARDGKRLRGCCSVSIKPHPAEAV